MFMTMSGLFNWFWKHVYSALTPVMVRFLALLPEGTSWNEYYCNRINELQKDPVLQVETDYFLFYCPSLGEYETIKSIVRAFKQSNPSCFIEICFFSASGYSVINRTKEKIIDATSYSPFDTKMAVSRYFKSRKISYVFFSGIHIWPAFTEYLIVHQIPYIYLAARLKKGWRKGWYYKMMGKYLNEASAIFAIDRNSEDLLFDLSLKAQIFRSGDPRAESIRFDLNQPPGDITLIKGFLKGAPALIFGSTHTEDESRILPLIPELIKKWKLIIAPHDINRGQSLKRACKLAILFSELPSKEEIDVLILDTIGHLKYIYPFASIAYVGGAFTNELHSTMEPLISGCFVIRGSGNRAQLSAPINQQDWLHTIETSEDLKKKIFELANIQTKKSYPSNLLNESQKGIQQVVKYISDTHS